MKSYVIIAALSGGLIAHSQQAGGGAAAGAGAAGTGAAGSSASGAGTAGGVVGGGIVAPGTGAAAPSAIAPGTAQPGGIANPPRGAGSSSISTPGSASTIGLGSADNTRLSGGRGVPFNALPLQVQSSLRSQSGGNPIGTVTQIMTPTGPVYTMSVVRGGTPTTIAVQPNGTLVDPQTVSRLAPGTSVVTPSGANATVNQRGTTTPGPVGTATVSGLATAQAGIPVTALPPAVQNALRSQLGGGQVQTISRDDTANGALFRVTVNRNGVPTELQFAANGTLLASTPLNDSLTSPSGAVVGAVPPGAVVVDDDAAEGAAGETQTGSGQLQPGQRFNTTTNIVVPPANTNTNRTSSLRVSDLPEAVTATLKNEAADADIRAINRDETPAGNTYRIAFRANDRFGEIVINEEGKVIRDSRDVPVVVIARDVAPDSTNNGQIEFARLPVAVQNAVKAYARPTEVRSARLARSRDGKTVYDVIIYGDGKRNRLEIAKDGTLNRFIEDVSIAAEGPTEKAPVIALGDLPQKVQDTIRRQTDTVRIDEIASTTLNGNTVYQVRWETNGEPVELTVAADGAVVYPTGTEVTASAGAAAPAPIPTEEEPEVVKTIDTSNEPAPAVEATGAPATTTSGISTSTESTDISQANDASANSAPLRQVRLEDVPEGVQNTLKKLGGSAVVESIAPKVEDSGIVYEVKFMQNGNSKTLLLDQDGAIKTETNE